MIEAPLKHAGPSQALFPSRRAYAAHGPIANQPHPGSGRRDVARSLCRNLRHTDRSLPDRHTGLGIEVQARLVKGALCNLRSLDCSLLLGDAKCLPLQDSSIDAAVLDIPYGRSAKILAKSKDFLLQESLRELFRVIKPGRRMVIVADSSLDGVLANAGFEIMQKHTDRVHGSLYKANIPLPKMMAKWEWKRGFFKPLPPHSRYRLCPVGHPRYGL